MAGLVEQNGADRIAGRLRLLVLVCLLVEDIEIAHIGDEPFGHGLDRHCKVDQTRGNGALGHAGVARAEVVGRLGKRQAAMLLDRLDAERAVAASAGKHDPDGTFGLVLGKGGKERVNRGALAAVGDGENAQTPVLDLKDAIGRHYINMIGADELVVFRDQHRHVRVARQNLRQHAFPLGSKVRDDDKGHAGLGRHGLEQILQRFDASCGGADANNGKGPIHRLPRQKGETSLGAGGCAKLRRALMNSKRLPLTCGEMHRRFAARQPLLRPVERFAGELNFLAQSQNLRACLRDQFDRADQPCAMLGIHRPLHGPGLCGRYWRRVDQHGASAPSRHADFSTISSIRKGQSAAAASGRLMLSSDLRSAATP